MFLCLVLFLIFVCFGLDFFLAVLFSFVFFFCSVFTFFFCFVFFCFFSIGFYVFFCLFFQHRLVTGDTGTVLIN